MSDRRCHTSTLWITSLLAFVLVAPIRTSGCVPASSRPDAMHRNLVPAPAPTKIRLSAPMDADDILQVNDLTSDKEDNEEQDQAVAGEEPRISALIPGSFGTITDRQWVALRSIPSHYPLRC